MPQVVRQARMGPLYAIVPPLLVCFTVAATAQSSDVKPLTLNQTVYQLKAGESTRVDAPPETMDFLLRAKTRHVEVDGEEKRGIVVAPNRAGDGILIAASLTTKPGAYRITLSASSEAGERRGATVSVTVDALTPIPSNATQPPVVLLNGWQVNLSSSCPVGNDPFGSLQQALMTGNNSASYRVPAAYFFDNCVECPNCQIQDLGSALAQFLNMIQYNTGVLVPQVDLVVHSMGGLIARAYLSGLQNSGLLQPPANPRIRKLILIATPNFGSFYAANFSDLISSGTQASQMIPGSSFLWDIATWNQRGDDLRGVDALAIVGNGGPWTSGIVLPTILQNESDGVVSLTSGSLGFTGSSPSRTRIVPYCHTDANAFPLDCSGPSGGQPQPGIADIDEAPETSQIIFSFLANTANWMSIGSTPASDPYLSQYGGLFFAWANAAGQYVTDLTQADWGTVALQTGGDAGTIFYDEFIQGTGTFQLASSSLGSVSCGSFTEPAGYYSAVRCKSSPLISSVTPRQKISSLGLVVTTGTTISINGSGFGQQQCPGCQIVVALSGATAGYPLKVSSWNNDGILAYLPATLPGLTLPGLLVVYVELSASAFDSINILAAAPNACSVNGVGSTNVSDVQAIVNEALGAAPPVNDLNGDGVVNVVDVQIAINAAVGLGCSAS